MAARTGSRRSAAAAAALAAAALLGVQGLLAGPVGAETSTYTATTTSGSIILNEGGANQQTITDPSVAFAGTVDDVAGTISGTTAFERSYTDSFAGPFGLTLYAAADLIPLSPAQPVTGTYDPTTGAVAATAGNRLVITVYNQAGASQSPSTDGKLTNQSGQTCFVDLSLDFSGTFDIAAGTLSISDPAFTVPSFPAAPAGSPAGGCGLATQELNERLAGPNNSVALNFAGQVSATTTTTTTTTSTSTSTTTSTTTTSQPAEPTTTTGPVDPTTTASPTTTVPGSGCSPNYTPCIPDVAGDDLDCIDLAISDIQVIGTDVYNLDGDNDGIGCDSEAPAATSTPPSGTLPRTGLDTPQLVTLGTLLLGSGAACIALSRRRIARA